MSEIPIWTSIRCPPAGAIIAALLVLLAQGAAAREPGGQEPGARGPEITTESPSRGVYRLRASHRVAATVEEVLELLADVEAQCEQGCRYTVPSIDAAEIVHRGGLPDLGQADDDRFFYWTRIDDVLDATYWTSMWVERGEDRGVVRYATPEASELERLATAERAHEPYFHHQAGTWTVEAEASSGNRPADDPEVRITVEMEARSDNWVINMASGQIRRGMARQVEVLFDHLAALAAD